MNGASYRPPKRERILRGTQALTVLDSISNWQVNVDHCHNCSANLHSTDENPWLGMQARQKPMASMTRKNKVDCCLLMYSSELSFDEIVEYVSWQCSWAWQAAATVGAPSISWPETSRDVEDSIRLQQHLGSLKEHRPVISCTAWQRTSFDRELSCELWSNFHWRLQANLEFLVLEFSPRDFVVIHQSGKGRCSEKLFDKLLVFANQTISFKNKLSDKRMG